MRIAPWTARFDGFVGHRKPKSIISYRILVAKRSEGGSAHVLNTLPQRKPGTVGHTRTLAGAHSEET